MPAYTTDSATIAGTAVGIDAFTSITETLLRQATTATLSVVGANLMITVSGTTPTATVGHQLSDGQSVELTNLADIRNLKMIRQASTSGTATISLSR